MPLTSQVIKVFVSSPNDVRDERRFAREVINEHNELSATGAGYILSPMLYEHHAAPGSGAPQEVIDRNVGKSGDSDIVIGILASTLGSADRTGKTGTQQELEDALTSWQRRGRPEVLLYIRQSPAFPTPPDVSEYVKTLKGRLLKRTYTSPEDFRDQLRNDLKLLESQHIKPKLLVPAGERDAMANLASRMWEFHFDDDKWRDFKNPAPVPMRVSMNGQVLLKSSTSADEVYGHTMPGVPRIVVTGEEASGKTFTLLSLIQIQLNAPREKHQTRVPVYLAATDWLPRSGSRERPIREWLLDELHATYKQKLKGKQSARTLVDDQQVLPFIDGVDELLAANTDDPQRMFDAFIAALLDWARYSPVVCACQSSVWRGIRENFVEFTEIEIQPFENAIESLDDRPQLAQIVRETPALTELCTTPFAVSLLRQVHEDQLSLVGKLRTVRSTHEGLKRLLENAYGTPPTSHKGFSRTERRQALEVIARRLSPGRSFEIELLQPGEFPFRHLYRAAASLALGAFIFVLVLLPSFASLLVERRLGGYSPMRAFLDAIEGAGSAALVGGALVCIGMYLARGWASFAISIGVAYGVARGIVLGTGLTDDLKAVAGEAHGIQVALVTSILFAGVMLVIFGWTKDTPDAIRPLQVRMVGLKKALRKATLWAVSSGITIGAAFWALWGIARGVSFGLMVMICLQVILLLSVNEAPSKVRPNQGIIVSLETSLTVGALALIAGPACFFLGYLSISWQSAIVNAILGANISLTMLLCGALPVIQHYALRVALAWRRILPLELVSFCNECTRLGILKRAGNRFQFSHDLVRQFFAGEALDK